MDKRRNDNKAQKALELYNLGFSLAEIAEKIGGTRQSIYDLLVRRKEYVPRKRQACQSQVFNGKKYSKRANGYYLATAKPRTLMHRDVWEFYNRPIPKGYDVHHIDRDRANNDINNLELLSKQEYSKKYATGNNQYTKKE